MIQGYWSNPIHYDNGYTPAVAGVEKTNVVIEMHSGAGNTGGLWYHVATVNVGNKSINWGPGTQWMRDSSLSGVDPVVAVSEGNVVAEVHSVCGSGSSAENGPIWTTIGIADTASNSIAWGSSTEIEDHCYNPSITISRDGKTAVVAYQLGNDGPDLYYRVGAVDAINKSVSWGPRYLFANGTYASIAMNDLGGMIAVFNSWQENTGYWYMVGSLEAASGTISWGGIHSFDNAELGGKVAMGNWSNVQPLGSYIITVFPGPKLNNTLWLRQAQGPDLSFPHPASWCAYWDPDAQYQTGVEPGVAIVYQGHQLEVHRSQDIDIARKLWYELF